MLVALSCDMLVRENWLADVIMRTFYTLIYYLVATKFPDSFFPFGKYFMRFRAMCVRRMVGGKCKDLEIESGVRIGTGRDVSIGDYVQIKEDCRLRNVDVHNYVMIAAEVMILHIGHKYQDVTTPMMFQGNKTYPKTVIEDDV